RETGRGFMELSSSRMITPTTGIINFPVSTFGRGRTSFIVSLTSFSFSFIVISFSALLRTRFVARNSFLDLFRFLFNRAILINVFHVRRINGHFGESFGKKSLLNRFSTYINVGQQAAVLVTLLDIELKRHFFAGNHALSDFVRFRPTGLNRFARMLRFGRVYEDKPDGFGFTVIQPYLKGIPVGHANNRTGQFRRLFLVVSAAHKGTRLMIRVEPR